MGSVVDLAIAGAVVGAILIAVCVVSLEDRRAVLTASVAFGLMLLFGYLGFWACAIVTTAVMFGVLLGAFEGSIKPGNAAISGVIVCVLAGVVLLIFAHYHIFYEESGTHATIIGAFYLFIAPLLVLMISAAQAEANREQHLPVPAPRPVTPVDEMHQQSAFGDAGFARAVYVQHALADRSGSEVNALTFRD